MGVRRRLGAIALAAFVLVTPALIAQAPNTPAPAAPATSMSPAQIKQEVGPFRMETLTVEPGDYDVVLTVVGRNLPPFFGTDTITPKMRFRHQFVIPGV